MLQKISSRGHYCDKGNLSKRLFHNLRFGYQKKIHTGFAKVHSACCITCSAIQRQRVPSIMMKKIKGALCMHKSQLSRILALLVILITVLIVVPGTTANAKSRGLPKSYQGTWHSKPIYTYETKHINKNIAEPRMKAVLHSKTIKWHWYGHSPKGYTHKWHTMYVGSASYGTYKLTGAVPQGGNTFIYRASRHHLVLAYEHGNQTDLYR